jgi:hypothetical protein
MSFRDNHIYFQNNSNIPISASVSTTGWFNGDSSYYNINPGGNEQWDRRLLDNTYSMDLRNNYGQTAHINVSPGDKVSIQKDIIYINGQYHDEYQFHK